MSGLLENAPLVKLIRNYSYIQDLSGRFSIILSSLVRTSIDDVIS